jgi:UrcA family protein
MNRFNPTLLTTAALALMTLPLVALADEKPPQVAVSYADLDLTHRAGTDELYRRISAAASAVCSSSKDQSLAHIALHKHCVQKAVSSTVAQVEELASAEMREPKLGLAR